MALRSSQPGSDARPALRCARTHSAAAVRIASAARPPLSAFPPAPRGLRVAVVHPAGMRGRPGVSAGPYIVHVPSTSRY